MNLLDQTQSNKSPSEKDNYDTKKAKDFKAEWRVWQSLRMNKKGCKNTVLAKTFRGFSPCVYKLLVKIFYFAMHGVVKIKTFIISGFPYQTEYIYLIKMHLRSII